MNLSTKHKQSHRQTEIRLVVAKRGRGDSEDGWIGSLQLAAANYYIQDR